MAKGFEIGGRVYPEDLNGSGEIDVESDGRGITRRGILKALGIALAGAPFAGTIYNAWQYGRQIDDTLAAIRGRIDLPREAETFPRGFILPEDERTGKDILCGMHSDYSAVPIVGGHDFSEQISHYLVPFIDQLPDGTNVHVLISEGAGDDCLDKLMDDYPNLTFAAYFLPFSKGGLTFPQDVVFATGRQVLADDRFIIAASSIEAKQFNALERAQQSRRAAMSLFEPIVSAGRVKGLLMGSEDEMEEAAGGVHDFGDEFLAERYPEKFLLKYVPVGITGGDLQLTRLPDGRSAAIVGKENLSRTVLSMQLEESPDAKCMDLNEIALGKFAEFLDRIKEAYMQYLGVDEVIIIDEPHIRCQMTLGANIRHEGLRSYSFFHSDMLVKTATAGDGRRVAFCNNQRVRESDPGYLLRIQEQFRELGYDVRLLECGPVPAMNYTNVVTFKPNRHSGTVVMLPQYGVPGDDEAAKVYESCGFEVKKADMSAISRLPVDERMTTGSAHCRFVVMS